MNKEIFRKKSIEQIQSPDNLKEYIKVVNPGIWIVFIAVLLLLAGAFVWGTFGKIEDKVAVTVTVDDNKIFCDYFEAAEKGMPAVINGINGKINSAVFPEITIILDEDIPDGIYTGYIVVDVISPISFVLN